MVLSRAELIKSLQHEVHILLHLASKIDRAELDYRPTPKQRSTFDLLRYMTYMGPAMVDAAKTGRFDTAAWSALEREAAARDFDGTIAAIASQTQLFETGLTALSDADMRGEIEIFGSRQTRGSFLVNLVLCGYAAYRTQLFCYLKACGRDDLSTINLWAGIDAPVKQ